MNAKEQDNPAFELSGMNQTATEPGQTATRISEEGTTDRGTPPSLPATADVAGIRVRLTPLRRQVARLRRLDPKTSEGKLMVRAGYSAETARTPRVKLGGVGSFDLEKALRPRDGAPTPTEARRLGLEVLADLAEDREQAPAVRGSAAKSLLDFSAAVGVEEESRVSEEEAVDAAADLLELAIHTVLVADRLGTERALEILQARRDELPVSPRWTESAEESLGRGWHSLRRVLGNVLAAGFRRFGDHPPARLYRLLREEKFPVQRSTVRTRGHVRTQD